MLKKFRIQFYSPSLEKGYSLYFPPFQSFQFTNVKIDLSSFLNFKINNAFCRIKAFEVAVSCTGFPSCGKLRRISNPSQLPQQIHKTFHQFPLIRRITAFVFESVNVRVVLARFTAISSIPTII